MACPGTQGARAVAVQAWDLASHDGSERAVVAAIVTWLGGRRGIETNPRTVLAKLGEFKRQRCELDEEWFGSPPWRKA